MSGRKRSRSSSDVGRMVFKRVKTYSPSMLVSMKRRRASMKFRGGVPDTPEQKYSDTNIQSSVSSSGAVQSIQQIAVGTDNTNRIGRKITVKSVEYDYTFAATQSDLSTTASYSEMMDCVRLSRLWDRQPAGGGTVPSYSDIYAAAPHAQTAPLAKRNMDHIDRVVVSATNVETISYAGPNTSHGHRYVKVDLGSRYDGTNANDISSGQLLLCWIDQNINGANNAQLNVGARVKFTDD